MIEIAPQPTMDPSPLRVVPTAALLRTYRAASAAEALGVHFVPSTATALVELFGSQTGDEGDKFARCEWREGPARVPILTECPNWFVGTVLERLPLGDHVGFVLDPQEVQLEVPQAEFTFHRARRIEPGHDA